MRNTDVQRRKEVVDEEKIPPPILGALVEDELPDTIIKWTRSEQWPQEVQRGDNQDRRDGIEESCEDGKEDRKFVVPDQREDIVEDSESRQDRDLSQSCFVCECLRGEVGEHVSKLYVSTCW